MYDEEDDIDILFEEMVDDWSDDQAAQQEDLLHLDPSGHARYYMWNRLFEEWGCYPFQITDRRQAKRNWCIDHHYNPKALSLVARENLTMDDINKAKAALSAAQVPMISFSTSSIPTCSGWSEICEYGYKPTVKEEQTMGYTEYNMEVDQRNHLKRRLDDVRHTKTRDLSSKFHIGEGHPARTKEEILAALKAGEVQFEEYYFDKDGKLRGDYNSAGTFYLKNPAEDTEGFKAAEKLLGKAYTAAKDAIIVKPLADGLAALNEFEKAEF